MRKAFVTVALLLVAACAASPAMRAAEKGDLAELRKEILASEKAGTMSDRAAADMARVVAAREVLAAPPAQASQRVGEVRACASELDDALADRMKVADAAGAEAALARLEDGRLSQDDARRWTSSADDRWRAVGARALTRAEDRPGLLRAMVDVSPRVRRAAMRAAETTGDPLLVSPLAEAARLDPEPLVKMDAVRAMASVATPDHVDVANRLRDLWPAADEALREDVAAAWASPRVFAAGGREALRVLVMGGDGPGVIAASGSILRSARIEDAELESAARAALVRAIAAGSERARLHAIAVAPLGPKRAGDATGAALLDAIRAAAHVGASSVEPRSTSDDAGVRLAALARLTESPADRAEATKALEALASHDASSDAARTLLASRARLALATAGDARVQAWIEQDLVDPDPRVRLSAVDALAALGRAGRGAPLLADADTSVRTRAACTLLLAARARPSAR